VHLSAQRRGSTSTAQETTVFHDHIPGSWIDLTDRLDAGGSLHRWARLEPALADVLDLPDLAGRLRPGTDPVRADELLGALVRLAAADGYDDADAVLVLLHLLGEGARALAVRLADLADDMLGLVVGELTVQIRAFPWRRRTRAYAANLLLDTKTALWRELRPHRTRTFPGAEEVLVDPTDARRVAELFDRSVPGPDSDGDLDLLDLLVWAKRTGVVDAENVALLLDVEHAREQGGAAQLRAAAEWGINERTLRRRRERTLTALQTASAAYLAACA
jgi:hypothetical protein